MAYVTLRQGNGECLTKYLLRSARLGVLLGRPKLRCWGQNCGLATMEALDYDEPEALTSAAHLWPFATACRLL